MGFAKTIQEVICSIKKNEKGEYIQVSRIKPEDTKSNMMEAVDIRLMFTTVDPNEGEVIRPTQKGVRVNSELIPELAAGIFKAMSEEERQEFLAMIEVDVQEE